MSTSTLDPEARFAISDLILRYGTAIDTRDWGLFRGIFTDDAYIDYTAAGIGTFTSADDFAQAMRKGHAPFGKTMHRLTNIVINAGDAITARTYGDAIVMAADNTTGHHAAAWYDDEIVHTTNGFKIARRTITMVLFEAIRTNLAATS
ncbi:nuclear transport factor 2 family protein [Rhodococcus xishaensis]|uniref:Nuclear transport factor 2 family protein n=1 Tax=Rhodococcus xishaensis TaxID=2487364 RepID=A0A3S3ZI28_9NOCA|nr:nuclear transport factor 2 family protein [Rhodococcus xishaensis]RVW01286.1 nuclear transport factor 2 family protein [Rhodococcus xishaensis]